MSEQALHLIAHRESIRVPETRRDAEYGGLLNLQLERDVEKARELQAMGGHGHAGRNEMAAEGTT